MLPLIVILCGTNREKLSVSFVKKYRSSFEAIVKR
jgi:hypothetical protein